MAAHDMHNHWNTKPETYTDTDVILDVSLEEISITIDGKLAFKHVGGVSKSDAQLIKFIAEGIAERFNTILVINELKQALN